MEPMEKGSQSKESLPEKGSQSKKSLSRAARIACGVATVVVVGGGVVWALKTLPNSNGPGALAPVVLTDSADGSLLAEEELDLFRVDASSEGVTVGPESDASAASDAPVIAGGARLPMGSEADLVVPEDKPSAGVNLTLRPFDRDSNSRVTARRHKKPKKGVVVSHLPSSKKSKVKRPAKPTKPKERSAAKPKNEGKKPETKPTETQGQVKPQKQETSQKPAAPENETSQTPQASQTQGSYSESTPTLSESSLLNGSSADTVTGENSKDLEGNPQKPEETPSEPEFSPEEALKKEIQAQKLDSRQYAESGSADLDGDGVAEYIVHVNELEESQGITRASWRLYHVKDNTLQVAYQAFSNGPLVVQGERVLSFYVDRSEKTPKLYVRQDKLISPGGEALTDEPAAPPAGMIEVEEALDDNGALTEAGIAALVPLLGAQAVTVLPAQAHRASVGGGAKPGADDLSIPKPQTFTSFEAFLNQEHVFDM